MLSLDESASNLLKKNKAVLHDFWKKYILKGVILVCFSSCEVNPKPAE